MKGKRSHFFSALFLTVMSGGMGSAYSQAPVDLLVDKFDQYRKKSLQEKIYVHTNQELYLTGELIWFKMYYIDGTLHKPLDISRVAYIEVVDRNHVPILQSKVSLAKGSGEGSIFLPVAINSGQYTLRAYTQWMKNFSPEFYFQKTITIVNPFLKLSTESAPVTQTWDAQFFPEGGHLVDGLTSKVAFRVVDHSGKGIDIKGVLVSSKNDTLCRFQSLKFGMGHFIFTPTAGLQYRAILEDAKGHRNSVQLPAAQDYGYVMQLVDSSDQSVVIRVSAKLNATTENAPVYVFVHARQIISVAKMNTLQSSRTQLVIDKNLLKEGISHITLFDSDLQPVSERLYFKALDKKMSIDLKLNSEYSIRGKVTLDISTLVQGKTPSPGSLSVSVYKADSLQTEKSSNLYSYCWLSSDLQGTVESPSYYFMDGNSEIRQGLDHVMLTHGWRKFMWNDILAKSNPEIKFAPEYRGHIIRGKLANTASGPAGGVATFLSTPGKNIQLYSSLSNPAGEVNYEVRDFYGSNKVIAHALAKEGETYKFELLNPFSDKYSATALPPFQLSPELAKQLLARTVGMQVQNYFHADDRDHFIAAAIDTLPFYGKPDEAYNLDDFTRFPIMEEVMREYVKGVIVRKNKEGFRFMVFDRLNEVLMRDSPLILLDGIPLTDADKIMEFDPIKVKRLEVFRKKFFLGPLTFQGIVSFKTYTGDDSGVELETENIALSYDGLQQQREFYSPQYDTYRTRESRLPDRRNQLYWAPSVLTGPEGVGRIEFYTSDVPGTYQVVIEGMNEQGYTGGTSATFKVKK